MDVEGKGVSEKEWRRQNIEWERRRREAEKDAECKHQREVYYLTGLVESSYTNPWDLTSFFNNLKLLI